MVEMALRSVYKRYNNAEHYFVIDFNLEIVGRELVVFIGPPGCGKSTTLRIIAGLEDITEGELSTGDKVMNGVAPKDRNTAMVLQNYTLYPYMTAFGSIAFGLRLRKYGKVKIRKRVEDAADILGLTKYLQRKPAAFSDGQCQCVALSRAIVYDTKVFLTDEPLSNLDAKLRVAIRIEIAKLHQCLETTAIYVTHDQTEAMIMADRIVIMRDGFIQQVGPSKEVYNAPENMFVAGFIDSPAMNLFEVTLSNGIISNQYGLKLAIPEGGNKELVEHGYEGKELIFGIRPEDIHSEQVTLTVMKDAVIKSGVVASGLLGAESMLYTKIGDTEFILKVDVHDFHHPGEIVDLALNINKGHFFGPQTEEVIR